MMFFAIEKASGSRAEKLAAVDLKAGKLVGNAELPFSKSYLRDVSADGTILLSSSGTFFPEQNRFDLWKIGKKGELIHFKGATTPKKIANARFVSGQRVALIDESLSLIHI